MAKRSSSDRLALRCFSFWATPMVFLMYTVFTASLQGEGSEPDVVSALTVLLTMSVLGFAVDSLFRCNDIFLLCQVAAQILILLLYVSPQNSEVAPPVSPEQSPGVAVRGAMHQMSSALKEGMDRVKLPKALKEGMDRVKLPKALKEGMDHVKLPKALQAGKSRWSEQDPASGEQDLAAGGSSARISVVLPCLNESIYTINTVRSFCERTPPEVLEEIIVVDDGSSPPLIGLLQESIDERCKLRVLRHKRPYGLMVAKQTGGDEAKGQVLGFFDCHVAPRAGWHREIMQLLAANPRRLVVPMIGDLDVDTWDEKPNGALTTKCYINFNADFWWYDDESDSIPVISGGLVATSREWWQASGGYDKAMRGWGGENIHQSLFAWLCGADILRAKSSVIAHMWRMDSDKRTVAKFHTHFRTDNLARVAATWFDEFKHKFRSGNLRSDIDVSASLQRRQALGCKPFSHFLHRFRRIYRDGGVLPQRVFRIRSLTAQLCLGRHLNSYVLTSCAQGSWFHLANWIPKDFPALDDLEDEDEPPGGAAAAPREVVCGEHKAAKCSECPQGHGADWCNQECMWVFGDCVRRPRAAASSQDPTRKRCCSGIREWNTMNCLDRLDATGPLPYFCDVHGANKNQHYIFDADGNIRHESGRCVTVDANGKVASGDCSSSTRWEKLDSFEPEETRLYHEAVRKYGLSEDLPAF